MNGRKSEEETLHGSKCCIRIGNVLSLSETCSLFLSLSFPICAAVCISLTASYTQHHSSTLLACLPRAHFCCVCENTCEDSTQAGIGEHAIRMFMHSFRCVARGRLCPLSAPSLCFWKRMAVNFTTVHVYG